MRDFIKNQVRCGGEMREEENGSTKGEQIDRDIAQRSTERIDKKERWSDEKKIKSNSPLLAST